MNSAKRHYSSSSNIEQHNNNKYKDKILFRIAIE